MASVFSSLSTAHEPSPGATPRSRRGPSLSPSLRFAQPVKRDRTTAELAQVIENEIIPRLMLANRPPAEDVSQGETASPCGSVGTRTLDTFFRMTLTSDADALVGFVELLMRGGITLEEAYVDLLRPTAQRLGAAWEEDSVSFTDVTIGLGRLQQVVRTFGWKLPAREAGPGAGSICFGLCPHEQHTFGLIVLEDFFRRAGWITSLDTTAEQDDAADRVRREWFDVFGLSATENTPVVQIVSTIARIRRASCNQRLFVLVGGRMFVERPELAAEVGGDATAVSGRDALLIADKVVRRQTFG